jgi:hypothetical protein
MNIDPETGRYVWSGLGDPAWCAVCGQRHAPDVTADVQTAREQYRRYERGEIPWSEVQS